MDNLPAKEEKLDLSLDGEEKLDYCGDLKIACDLGECDTYNRICK